MSADLGSLLTTLFTDPVYGIPLLLWVVLGVVWFLWGHGVPPPALLPYRANRVRSRDPVSAMYWALQEHRYSDAIVFAYQRVEAAFQHRFGTSIRFIPWRRKERLKLGLDDPRPYQRVVRDMVDALDVASRLEGKPLIRAIHQLLRPYREQRLERRLRKVMDDLDWMLPMLEGRA